METLFEPMIFTRHKLRLHALIIERQAWFSARDLCRLMGLFFESRLTRKLDSDQLRTVHLNYYDAPTQVPMISESAVYALLIYHHHPANRQLRQWLTHEVMPLLLDTPARQRNNAPTPARLEWQGAELSVLHWRNEAWIRLRDMPSLLPGREVLQSKAKNGFARISRIFGVQPRPRRVLKPDSSS